MTPLPASVDTDNPDKRVSQGASPVVFVLVLIALSLPFGLFGSQTNIHLLPGVPISALMFVCPSMTALLLVYRTHKTMGVRTLLKRAFDYNHIGSKRWFIPILLLAPAIKVLSYGLMRAIGLPLPTPHVSLLVVLGLCIVFFIGALGEELGWSGYVTNPLLERWNALQAGIALGVVWAVWHVVPLMQVNRPVGWILWWCLGTVAARVLLVWLYINTGKSVFAATLFHATMNISWQLFPINGSHFDPRIDALVTTALAVIVVLLWKSQMLMNGNGFRWRIAKPR